MIKKNYLIGSRALALQDPLFKLKDNRDIDVISDEPIPGFEFHDRRFLNNDSFDNYALNTPIIINNVELYPINLKGLAIIKRSHLWRDLKFDRHIGVYHRFLSKHLSNMNDIDTELLNDRIQLSYKEFNDYRPISLRKTVKDFFDDAVTKKYDHDYLHELMAFYNKPLYTQLQYYSSMAWCEKELWDKLSYEDKCKCVAEETYVISLERFLIPSDWNYYNKLAFIKSLHKVCTTLTSGWFRDFAIDNYPSIINMFSEDKINQVQQILKNSV